MTKMTKTTLATRFSRIHFSSQKGEWNTPDDLFKVLNEEFHFTFDPCIPPKVGNFKGNGLKAKWGKRVFCNMPYHEVMKWLEKGWMALCDNESRLIVFLIPARTETKWFSYLDNRGAEFRRLRKRLSFSNHGNNAPFPSMIAILTRKDVLKYWKKLGIR